MKPKKPSAAARDFDTEIAEAPVLGAIVPTRKILGAGDTLFRQGDRSTGLFYLAAGRIRLTRLTPSGSEITMHNVRPGEFFAEASLFSSHYHCDAIATTECRVLAYAKKSLIAEFGNNAEDLWRFTERLARQVQGLRTRLTLRQIRSASERVLQALLLQCGKDGHWTPDGTLKQFAEEIGLTHEALYRALAALERSGAISRTADGIELAMK